MNTIDINPGPSHGLGFQADSIAAGDKLFFRASDATGNDELRWIDTTVATPTVNAVDLVSGSGGSFAGSSGGAQGFENGFTVVGDQLFFTATTSSFGVELFSLSLVGLGETVTIDQVIANSTTWQPTFRDFVDSGFNDGLTEGYRIPAESVESLPWANVDEIKLQFNEDVGASLGVGDFLLAGQSGFDADFVPGVVPSITGVTFDAATNMATVQLDQGMGPNLFSLTVFTEGIQTAGGERLVGGDQSLSLFVLPGDAVDSHVPAGGVYIVNGQDATFIRDRLTGFLFDSPGNNAFDGAYFGYDVRADIDDDGDVDGGDSTLARTFLSSFFWVIPSVSSSSASSSATASFSMEREDRDSPEIQPAQPQSIRSTTSNDQAASDLAELTVAPQSGDHYAEEADDIYAEGVESLFVDLKDGLLSI